ncbi:MAG: ABC transporter permease [Sulfolobus sp.]
MVAHSRAFKIISFFLTILIVFPIMFLLYYGYGPFYVRSAAFGKAVLSSVELSFFASALAVIIEIVAFTPLAYYLARHKSVVMESLVDVPASIPHPVVGIALLFIDSPLNPVGKFLNKIGINFYYTYLGLFLALIIVSTPVYVRAMQSYFESLPTYYEEFAESLGMSELKVFYRIMFPMSVGAIISSGLTAMARAISEFGSVVIVAPFVTGWIFNGDCVASVFIYNEFESYFNASVSSAATLIVFSLILILAARLVSYFLIKRRYTYYL